jgi:DNA-binding transcriptional MerR regulator
MGSAASRRETSMSIGEVIAMLAPQFPDLSVSKLRLWEAEGLVEPARAPSGYRKYTHFDVERLRYAMTLQRDYYWPLRRIRDHLEAVAGGREDPVASVVGPRSVDAGASVRHHPASSQPAEGVTPGSQRASGQQQSRLSARDVCQATGLDAGQLDELVSFGLLQPISSGWYDAHALAVATAAAELAGFGLGPRHLRSFRAAADREVGLVEQVVSPLRAGRGGSRSSARAKDRAGEIVTVALRLHAALVRAGLARAGLG